MWRWDSNPRPLDRESFGGTTRPEYYRVLYSTKQRDLLTPLRMVMAHAFVFLSPTITQKRPTNIQKRPTNIQKRPTNIQKRPTSIQKRPTDIQKRPTNIQKRPTNVQKRPTNTQNYYKK